MFVVTPKASTGEWAPRGGTSSSPPGAAPTMRNKKFFNVRTHLAIDDVESVSRNV